MLRITGEESGSIVGAVVILGGGLKPPPLAEASQRPVLDTQIGEHTTVLDAWMDRLDELPGGPPAERVLVLGKNLPLPTPDARRSGDVRVFRDSDEYRGPAGSVRDAVAELDSESLVLIVEGNRFLSGSLAPLVSSHIEHNANITVGHNADGTPGGVYAVRRGALDLVPPKGFMDLKEQWLGLAQRTGLNIRAFNFAPASSLPIRTLSDLLRAAALRWNAEGHPARTISSPDKDPGRGTRGNASVGQVVGPESGTRIIGESGRWGPVVSPGADVGLSAVVTESIIMPDASVGEGALVARSVVMPGATVEPGAEVLDDIVAPGEVRSGVRSVAAGVFG